MSVTNTQTDTTFAVCKRRPRCRRTSLPLAANATQRASPFPSRATERKERDDRARVLEPVSATAPGNTRALFRSTLGKELGLWPGTRVFMGDWASSPPRFNTYSHDSTHMGAARPAPGFFLPFGSLTVGTPVSNLKPRCWDLGLGLIETPDSGLGTW
jgi:hypothetical protein